MPPAPLRFRDIILFQIGNADSIRRVVASRWSLVIGLTLVFTAAIARNYDQTFLLLHGERFAGPFIVPVVSSLLVFIAIYKSCTRSPDNNGHPGFWRQYPGFLAAFLMTAPLAWFYAIPVEAMTDNLLTAARWNVFFLSLVSLWRVWLITRVAQVITGAPFFRLLFPILIPASAEAYVGTVFAGFGLAGAMGGILPPDKEFQLEALSIILTWSAIVFWISVAACIAIPIIRWRVSEGWTNSFAGTWTSPPKWALLATGGIAFAWLAIAVPWQVKIQNRVHLAHLVREKKFDGAVGFLRAKERRDFPPGPAFYKDNRFAYSANLTEVFNRLNSDDPPWIFTEYREVAEAVLIDELGVYWSEYSEDDRKFVQALSKIPGGRESLRSSAEWLLTSSRAGGLGRRSADDRHAFIADLEAAGIEIPHEWRPVTLPPPPGAEAGDTETSPAN